MFTDFYFGLDLNSSGPFPCAGNGPNFYIGRLGYGDSPDSSYFDVTTAQSLGTPFTFAVWGLDGSGSGSGYTPTTWGQKQAEAFIAAWFDQTGTTNGKYVGGLTLFADIEGGEGWGTNQTGDQEVLQSFLTYVNGYDSGYFNSGIYISTDHWNSYFGSSTWSPGQPFVLWLAGADCSLAPGDCAAAQQAFNNTITNTYLGNYRVMIWQYLATVIGCSVTQDYDITPYTGYQNSKWNPTT